MRGILVIEHTAGDGPGHFGEWLAERGLPITHVRVHAGDAVPAAVGEHVGLCVLGGPMSANDEHLGHIRAELGLVRDALARGVPVIGHCLGGQLLARVLGAAVGRSPAPEIGWHAVRVADGPDARRWFGSAREAVVMQWHREAFGLPAGAVALAGSDACPHQAFAWGGVHLGLQFHPEADAAKVRHWLAKDRGEADALARVPTVQRPEQIEAGVARHLAPMRELAYRLYDAWAHGLKG